MIECRTQILQQAAFMPVALGGLPRARIRSRLEGWLSRLEKMAKQIHSGSGRAPEL
jgi:hypothetical protein